MKVGEGRHDVVLLRFCDYQFITHQMISGLLFYSTQHYSLHVMGGGGAGGAGGNKTSWTWRRRCFSGTSYNTNNARCRCVPSRPLRSFPLSNQPQGRFPLQIHTDNLAPNLHPPSTGLPSTTYIHEHTVRCTAPAIHSAQSTSSTNIIQG